MLSDTSQYVYFPLTLVGLKGVNCSKTGNQVKQPYTMAVCLLYLSYLRTIIFCVRKCRMDAILPSSTPIAFLCCPGFGMLVLECQGRSGGGGACHDVEIVIFPYPRWMELYSWKGLSLKLLRFESFGVRRCSFSAPTSGHYRYRPSSI